MTFVAQDPVLRFSHKYRLDARGCHIWQSTIKRDGYGQFWLAGKTMKSHHAAYRMFRGEIPQGMCVLHRCDVRVCVNPNHLFLGTQKDNVLDMDKKGRRGTRAKLDAAQVLVVKAMLSEGRSQQEIADAIGVHQTLVSRVKSGKTATYQIS